MTSGTYLALANIDKAYQNAYVFQVFITKPTTPSRSSRTASRGNRAPGHAGRQHQRSREPGPEEPGPEEPRPKKPGPEKPAPSDVLVQNTTFTLGVERGGVASGLRIRAEATSARVRSANGSRPDRRSAPWRRRATPTRSIVTVRRLPDQRRESARKFDPYGDQSGAADPPSVVVADYWCTTRPRAAPSRQDGPDLAVPDPPTAGVSLRDGAGRPDGDLPVAPVVDVDQPGDPEPRALTGTASTCPTATSAVIGPAPELRTGRSRRTERRGCHHAAAGRPATSATSWPATESIAPRSITIPADIPLLNADGTGTYYLYPT